MKDQLIKYLKAKATTITVEEINQIVAIVEKLEEPKLPEEKTDKK